MVVSKDQTLARSEQEYRKDEYIEDVTWWYEDMNFIFEQQNNILRTSPVSEENIVFATRKFNAYVVDNFLSQLIFVF